MKFYIRSTAYRESPDTLLCTYPQLKNFPYGIEPEIHYRRQWIKTEHGTYIHQETPCEVPRLYLDICDLKQLTDLQVNCLGIELIITTTRDSKPEIEIYDGYRE